MKVDINYMRKCSARIKKYPVHTRAEKKQIEEGKSSIKLSIGQPIYPCNFVKRRDTFAGADYCVSKPRNINPNDIYVPEYFRLKIIMAIIINFDRALVFNRISDIDFKLGMTYRFIDEYVGDFKCINKAFSMVSMLIDNELSIMRSIGDYNYKWHIRKIYPSCFVSKAKFRYVGSSDDAAADFISSKQKANDARKSASDYKLDILIRIINTRSISKIRKIAKSNGVLKNTGEKKDGRNEKFLFSVYNKRLKFDGFKEMKTSTLYSYLNRAVNFLGVTLLELRILADKMAEDIENGKKGYVPDFSSIDELDNVCCYVEDS